MLIMSALRRKNALFTDPLPGRVSAVIFSRRLKVHRSGAFRHLPDPMWAFLCLLVGLWPSLKGLRHL